MRVAFDSKHLILIGAVFFLLLAIGIYVFSEKSPTETQPAKTNPQSSATQPSSSSQPSSSQPPTSKPQPPPASKPSVPAPVIEMTVTSEPEPQTPDGWVVKSRGDIPVAQPWISAGTWQGAIYIQVWNKAILNPNDGPNGPDGLNKSAESGYPLPGAHVFSAIGRTGNNAPFYIGRFKELYLNTPQVLYLGPNEEPGSQGNGFQDNTGDWAYKISVRK